MALETIWSRCPPRLRAFLGSRQGLSVAAVLAVAVVAVVLTTRDKSSPKIAVGADTEVSSQAKREEKIISRSQQPCS